MLGSEALWIFTATCLFALCSYASVRNVPCDRSRHIFTATWGVITDGPSGYNYTQDSHCEWLIRAPNKTQFITLIFRTMGTECSFDYVFVYGGDTFNAPLLGSFSGKTEPQQVISSAGSMLILLYSDRNYVLGGFQAEFSVSDCPRNCSNNGDCVRTCADEDCRHICVCKNNWGGADCSTQLCPEDCGMKQGRGLCAGRRCQCRSGFSGMSCSLSEDDHVGNRWHRLSHSSHGLKPRAAHTAVYVADTDALYVFGGYDLNNILGDLSVYSFSTSLWEDGAGNILGSEGNSPSDQALLEAVLRQDVGSVNPQSFLATFLYPFSENASSKHTPRRPKTVQSPIPSETSANAERSSNDASGNNTDSPSPEPRYGHAAARYPGGFAIYGGKLRNGNLSDEMWFFNVATKKWSLRCPLCDVKPPPLTRHTITLVDGGQRNVSYLYLFGGSTYTGEFSSRLFRISLVLENPSLDLWEEVRPRGGKQLDMRLVAHTTSYHEASDSLLVYGGVIASLARLSRLSDRMFLFNLENRLWSEVHYPRSDLPDNYVPHERAFHTSSILGNYLVVFGGYCHRHNKEEICYDNQIYFYHLGCHTWVSHEIFGALENGTRYGKQQGVFAQAADVRSGNTLLVVGGYHGNVNADLWAYTVPPTLASRAGDPFDPEVVCSHHHSHAECASNPECGWCSVDSSCSPRTAGVTCTTNLQTRRCPGICPALGTCQACLVHGDMPVSSALSGSVIQKLKLGQCTWCVQNARCHHKDDNFGVCGVSEDAPSQVPGWWGPQGTEVTSVKECQVKDRRPGLTFVKYKFPANFSQPDYVSIINATTADFDMQTYTNTVFSNLRGATYIGGTMTARLLGFLRTPESWNASKETLRLCTTYSSTILKLSGNNSTAVDIVGNVTAEASTCALASWPSGETVELESGRYLVDLLAKGAYSSQQGSEPSRMVLMHNRSAERIFTFEYLEPFENGTCSAYTNCLHCLTDSLCGWCQINSQCVSRYSNVSETCRSSLVNDWQYLTLQPSGCTNCSNYIACDNCVSSGICEWWAEDARCVRRGRSPQAVVDLEQCPPPCHTRTSCTSCLDDRDRCVWCEATQECFSFSVYTSQYQFGLCREWVDQNIQHRFLMPHARGANQCKNCSRHLNCSSCLHTLSCGWCYSEENPIQGVCVPGDFNEPMGISCADTMKVTFSSSFNDTEIGWSYGQCPDVDECELKLHDCHENATCSNTHGSYVCQCRRGFFGDGHQSCNRTCYEDCVHGVCSMAPDYMCVCDLGWFGKDCSQDCGCNNHSTCSQGFGLCDECQNWTTGQFCEKCKKGSYGNATTMEGCKQCACNQHGNPELGQCDSDNGTCYCQHNTEGPQCETCKKGYYGDPRNGGTCFYQCSARGMVIGMESQGIGSGYSDVTPWESRLEGQPVRECLWILSKSHLEGETTTESVIQLTIAPDVNVTCERNAIYVYDALPNVVLSSASHHNHALGTFCWRGSDSPFVVESNTGIMTVMFKQGGREEGFNATFNIFSCPDNCPEGRICEDEKCVCKEGWTGPNCTLTVCPRNCSYHLRQGTCDKGYGRCQCSPGFGELDCSVRIQEGQLVFTELFHSARLSDSFDHLRKMIPRFGHSLVTDRRGSLWMFGGFSPSHGPLNDIRLFDTRNNTWMQVTVDSTIETSMPQGRYLHAAEIVHSRREIFVLGGITDKEGTIGLSNYTLRDFWKFSITHQGWVDIQSDFTPPPLAGHTLTLRKNEDSESLVVIGGFSQRAGFMEAVWNYDLITEKWSTLPVKGKGPGDIYGHTTVYHEPSETLYIFGGYSYTGSGFSNKLYGLHFPSATWSILPTFEEYSPIPAPRFLHSAVTTDNFMLVLAGHLPTRANVSEFLFAYSYACNQWVRLLGDHAVGIPPPWTYGQDMALDPESGAIFVIGGFTGEVVSHVTRINVPEDLCNLWSGKDKCRLYLGCSYCAVSRGDAAILSDCYSSSLPLPDVCKYHNGTLITNNGMACDSHWLNGRTCNLYHECDECSVRWPILWDQGPSCQWEGSCQGFNGTYADCIPPCVASDCEKCLEEDGCTWSEDDQCEKAKETEVDFTCPLPCSEYSDCTGCLGANGCHWSVGLQECMSSVQQPLYCSGGACGLMLHSGQTTECPQPCSTALQCSSCLRSTHCGWCASDVPLSGEGVCAAGAMHEPSLESCPENSTWHYVTCPLENECLNGHHMCDEVSEVCEDREVGFICKCAPGFASTSADSKCEPVCTQGCVRGDCVEPNKCLCDFGYVGSNCSIQCQCNGHSDCEGPDKLDKCIECHNNTYGSQCEKCKPQFVGDATNNGSCVPCFDYCHGHAHNCYEETYSPVVEGQMSPTENSPYGASCTQCKNFTKGHRCETCKSGHFRGTDDLRAPCRPCECHGHGDECDPVTGEKCNCGNNTESECLGTVNNNSNQQCWMLQCSKCKETYYGTPTDGHQCYKQMTLDHRFCLDHKLQEECKLKPSPLYPGQSVFIVVHPRYVNVDIRIILDVSEGALDLRMSPKDDFLVVDRSNGTDQVSWDAKYSLHIGADGMSIMDVSVLHLNKTGDGLPYWSLQKEAPNKLTYYVTVKNKNTFLSVKNIRNRLVLTLPKDRSVLRHDLVNTKFYIALTSVSQTTPSYGIIFFKQDQLHIDLFVFFSVFFSCFFLFLAACVVAWKAKQAAELRRARRRHVVEMLHMAKRPFAGLVVDLPPEETDPTRSGSRRGKQLSAVRPIAIEPTEDGVAGVATVFIRLPGGDAPPVRLALASALILMSRVYPLNSRAFLRRRNSHHVPS